LATTGERRAAGAFVIVATEAMCELGIAEFATRSNQKRVHPRHCGAHPRLFGNRGATPPARWVPHSLSAFRPPRTGHDQSQGWMEQQFT